VSGDWDDLVTTALIGTERRSFTGGEGALLDRAAARTVARRAGQLPLNAAQPPPPCDPDPGTTVSRKAASTLTRMLAGKNQDLIPEWLTAARARGKRPPDQLLPALLDRARTDASLRHLLASNRTRWLATLNPDWSFAGPVTPDHWRLGTTAERLSYLRTVRTTDPGRARGLIEQSWPKASAQERSGFLLVLRDSLVPEDEPLLEKALDDPARDIRDKAAYLLATLPGSKFSNEMTRRAHDAVRLDHGRITIIQPPPNDLTLIIARTPLPTWGQPPEQIPRPLIDGWTQAAMAQHDPAWASALLNVAEPATRERLLKSIPAPWPDELTAKALRTGASPLVALAARRGKPFEHNTDDSAPDNVPKIIREAMRTLQFRHDMLKELDD
jgi:hypothetical protein